jgi:hypothetical protein
MALIGKATVPGAYICDLIPASEATCYQIAIVILHVPLSETPTSLGSISSRGDNG